MYWYLPVLVLVLTLLVLVLELRSWLRDWLKVGPGQRLSTLWFASSIILLYWRTPQWSFAILMTWCQTSLSLAFLQAMWTPKFKDWRSSSIVLSQVVVGRPIGLLQSAGGLRAVEMTWWSILGLLYSFSVCKSHKIPPRMHQTSPFSNQPRPPPADHFPSGRGHTHPVVICKVHITQRQRENTKQHKSQVKHHRYRLI